MNGEQKKFLDKNGLKILWNQISMHDYPNNAALTSVINAIDANKADRADIPRIDTTLSAAGAAADAKAVGQAIENIELTPGPKGERGIDGKDGITPHIGENGNWWIGDEDTGISVEVADEQINDALEAYMANNPLVKSVNGTTPDENGNVDLELPSGGADGLYFDETTWTLYLMSKGQIIGNGVQLPTAEGGPTNNAVLTLENTTGWSSKTISLDSDCRFSFRWSSTEDGISTGPGIVAVKVANVLQYTSKVDQREYTLDIREYLILGYNLVHVTVTDAYGNSETITLGVTMYDPAALISTKLVERTLTGNYTNDRVTKIGPRAFAGLTLGRLSLPNATGSIELSLTDLTADEVELAGVTSTSYWMVNGSTIGVLRLPNVTTITSDEDFRAKRVERVVFDRLKVWNKSLRGMYLQVVTFDFHDLKSFPNLPSGGLLSNLIIRTPDVCTLGSAPESTTAKLFVPEDLLEQYKVASNWSAMADRIFAIEQHPEICEVNENV